MAHDTGFVFNLFLKRKLHFFYENPVFNKITKVQFQALPSTKTIGLNSNFCIVTDIPDYLETKIDKNLKSWKTRTIRQYKGFICNFRGYENAKDYVKDNFSKKAMRSMVAKKRQLETRHAISYVFYFGEINRTQYEFLFDRFFTLMKKRFDVKKVYNRYLLEWKKYYDIVYPMILNKEASLFVIYNGKEPIAMALDFYMEDVCFGYIQIFNPEYGKYPMGDVAMFKRLEWLMERDIWIFDFLMGETYYKRKWSNMKYFYEHQIFYRSGSLSALIKLFFMVGKLKFKQFLRDKGILGKMFSMDRFLYKKMSKKLIHYDWKNP
ncbi:GNAT family N-acetyltransferase [Muricauda sp. JGD-17]|uniref:GNAT family N-acetyltransferase n=1 Tax=Flagellimonas ochracea TaxID=2696472 RepID=A0A964TAQ0_9FLAO|nr:GNAT family N-acetyltransferase [Allomuricauda ochracea]NAY90588.1 GNAT family N-acetyltransferase [Allomuricauda ochracea]